MLPVGRRTKRTPFTNLGRGPPVVLLVGLLVIVQGILDWSLDEEAKLIRYLATATPLVEISGHRLQNVGACRPRYPMLRPRGVKQLMAVNVGKAGRAGRAGRAGKPPKKWVIPEEDFKLNEYRSQDVPWIQVSKDLQRDANCCKSRWNCLWKAAILNLKQSKL